MSSQCNGRLSEVAKEILQYWQRHPEAQDTLDGIWQWWLRGGDNGPVKDAVQVALDELIAIGLTAVIDGPNKIPFYRLRQDQHEWIQRILEK